MYEVQYFIRSVSLSNVRSRQESVAGGDTCVGEGGGAGVTVGVPHEPRGACQHVRVTGHVTLDKLVGVGVGVELADLTGSIQAGVDAHSRAWGSKAEL